MQKKKWKVAIVGCGGFAQGQYLPNISKEAYAETVAVVDVNPEFTKSVAEKYGVPNWYTSVEDLIANCDFDIAIDAASIQQHHSVNMAILGAGKHLITQKPAAETVQEITEQIELAKKMGVKMVCAPVHPLRYDLNTALQLISDGVIGDAYYAKCNMSHGGPEYFQYRGMDSSWFYEPGAGALVDMGVHGLQIVTAIFGPAKAVSCMAKVTTPVRTIRSGAFDGKKIQSDKIPDQYVITLDFGDNKMAVVDTGFSQKATKAPQLEIFGDLGTISFTKPYMTNPVPEVYMDCPEKGIRGWVQMDEGIKPPRKLLSQCCVLWDLIDAIENDREPVLSGERARHLQEIMCKIPEAIETGCRVELTTTF